MTSATNGDGHLAIGAHTEGYRLRAHGIFPHALSWAELRAAHIGLSQVMLLPGHNAVIDFDHFNLWAWEAELLAGSHNGWPRRQNDREFARSLRLVLNLLFQGPAHGRAGFAQSASQFDQLAEVLNPHAFKVLFAGTEIVSYLCFPLLEGLLKRRAAAFMTPDGAVTSHFDVPGRGDASQRYSYVPGRRISSLRDLLFLEQERVADPELRVDIDELVARLPALVTDASHGFDVVYRWRNTSLHGVGGFQTVGASVLGLTLRILLSELTGEYEEYRTSVIQAIRGRRPSPGLGHDTHYYPPSNGQ